MAGLKLKPLSKQYLENEDKADRSTADQIRRNESIPDSYVYGTGAVRLLRKGLTLQSTINRYRSGMYFAMKDAWGDDIAKEKEAVMIDLHARAIKIEAEKTNPNRQ